MSVLVNGSPTEEFKPTRGLRQGDPLAPFLFLIVAEGLAGLVRKAVKEDLLSGIKVGRAEVDCCLLQFADDTLFMCEDSFSNVFTIKVILRVFELASGLKVNFYKSKLAGLQVEKNTLELYAKTLNCDVMHIPFIYLGMQVGANPRRKKFWEPVVEKVKARLSTWKGKCLSFAGRLCLIKSVLTSIPLFYLSFYKAPTSICDKISSLQRSFLWAWGKDGKHISWVSWEKVCKSQEEGGLGVKNIRKFNRALLAKWKWRLMSEENGKWKQILLSKYGSGVGTNQGSGSQNSWWWSDLGKVCDEGEGEGWFHNHVAWKVGNGDKIRFWDDAWVDNNKLKFQFPRLYSISLDKGKLVGELGRWEELGWSWRLRWRRARFEWEKSMEADLMNLITGKIANKESEDSIVWSGDTEGIFSVKSAYLTLCNSPNGVLHNVYSLLWQAKAKRKEVCTAWRALLGRLPTYDNLIRRGLVVNSSLCVLCKAAEESTQHIFINSIFAQRVWFLCFRWIGILSVQHKEIINHFESFHLIHLSIKQNQVWKGLWIVIVRSIWDQRNLVVFKQGIPDAEEIFHSAQLSTWLCLKYGAGSTSSSFSDWMLNPGLCLHDY